MSALKEDKIYPDQLAIISSNYFIYISSLMKLSQAFYQQNSIKDYRKYLPLKDKTKQNKKKQSNGKNKTEGNQFYLDEAEHINEAKHNLLHVSQDDLLLEVDDHRVFHETMVKPRTAQNLKPRKNIQQFEAWPSYQKDQKIDMHSKSFKKSLEKKNNLEVEAGESFENTMLRYHTENNKAKLRLKSASTMRPSPAQITALKQSLDRTAFNKSCLNSFSPQVFINHIINIDSKFQQQKKSRERHPKKTNKNYLKKSLNLNSQLSFQKPNKKYYESLNLSTAGKQKRVKIEKQDKNENEREIICSKSSIVFEEEDVGPKCTKIDAKNKMVGSLFRNKSKAKKTQMSLRASGEWIKPKQLKTNLCRVYRLSDNSKIFKDIDRIVNLIESETAVSKY